MFVLIGDRILLPTNETGTVATVNPTEQQIEVTLPNGGSQVIEITALTWRPTPGLSFAERFRLGAWTVTA